MSAPEKDDPARGWSAAQRLVEEDADRVAALSDEDFEREMRAMPDPAHVPSVDAIVVRAARSHRAQRPKTVVAREAVAGGAAVRPDAGGPRDAGVPRDAAVARDAEASVIAIRPLWRVLIAAAIVGVLAVAIALLAPKPQRPSNPETTDDPLARATQLRHDAVTACNEQRFAACEAELDEAQRLDPAGEVLPEVRAARERLRVVPPPPRVPPPDDKPTPR